MGDVGDGALVAYEVGGLGVAEVFVEDAVEAAGFVLVAVYAVLDWLGGVFEERLVGRRRIGNDARQ